MTICTVTKEPHKVLSLQHIHDSCSYCPSGEVIRYTDHEELLCSWQDSLACNVRDQPRLILTIDGR